MILKDQNSGFGMVGVLVMLAISSIVAAHGTELLLGNMRLHRRVEIKGNFRVMTTHLNQWLDSKNRCTQLLAGQQAQVGTTVRLDSLGTNSHPLVSVGNSSNGYRIESIELTDIHANASMPGERTLTLRVRGHSLSESSVPLFQEFPLIVEVNQREEIVSCSTAAFATSQFWFCDTEHDLSERLPPTWRRHPARPGYWIIEEAIQNRIESCQLNAMDDDVATRLQQWTYREGGTGELKQNPIEFVSQPSSRAGNPNFIRCLAGNFQATECIKRTHALINGAYEEINTVLPASYRWAEVPYDNPETDRASPNKCFIGKIETAQGQKWAVSAAAACSLVTCQATCSLRR